MLGNQTAQPETLGDLVPAPDAFRLDQVLDTPLDGTPADLHYAFNKNQLASKVWLLDRLRAVTPGPFQTVYVLGGWYGALAALLLNDARFRVETVISIDVDPACAAVAQQVNRRHAAAGRFEAITADAALAPYRPHGGEAEDLIVNTSCEHMPPDGRWFARIPPGSLLALQTNDYVACQEHINCVPDLAAFKAQVPLSEIYDEGALARRYYTRFMLIGRK